MLTTTGTPGHARRFLLAGIFVSLSACKMGTVNTAAAHGATVAVSIDPADVSVDTGGSVTFTATVTGSSNAAVSWSVIGEGSITAGGVYTAPATPGTYQVVAISLADPSRSATATVTVSEPAPEPVTVIVSPQSASVETGGLVSFTAVVTGATDTRVTWSVTGGEASGTIDEAGVYTAPETSGTYEVVATSVDDSTKSATSSVTVSSPPPPLGDVSVVVSPSTASIATGATLQLRASVTGAADTQVTWSVTGGAAGGSVTAGGLYTAPATAGSYTVVATSVADPTASDSATITVTAPVPVVTISIKPTAATIQTGGSRTFTATVKGTTNTAVTWGVVGGAANGTVTSAGVYTAPSTAGKFTVVATSVADTTKSAAATVTVTTAATVAVSINPPYASVAPSGTATFTASVTGTANTAVTWSVAGGAINGSITSAGVYKAPSTVGTYTVVATSVADASRSASATVYVSVPGTVSITVQPPTMVVKAGGVAAFTAVLSGTGNATVAWSVTGGTITTGGVYTAPSTAGTYAVVATSAADPEKSASATVTVGDNRAGTNVPAGAVTTQTWNAAGSPYRLMGDVYIPSGNRLTIQPGVEVRAMGHYRLEGPGIIDARGTSPSQRDILFTADDKTRGWYGILIWNGQGQYYVPPDIGDYHLENCIVEYVNKDESNPRSWGNVVYSDEYGAVYIYGANYPNPGVKFDHLFLNGLLLRHNRALYMTSPQGMAGGLYLNGVNGKDPVWTDMVFDDNQTVDYGGAVAAHHCSGITFKNGMMTNNRAVQPDTAGEGGALGYFDAAGPMTLDHVIYQGNDPPGFADSGEQYQVVVINPP